MVTTMRSVLNRLREHRIKLRRQLANFTSESKAILTVTSNFTVKSSLRVLSLEQGWRILFADCLEKGLCLQRLNKVWILVYDRNLPDVEMALRFLYAAYIESCAVSDCTFGCAELPVPF
jgi:hypothetical protein